MNQTTNITSSYIDCVNSTINVTSTIDCHDDEEEDVVVGGGVFTSKMFVTGLAILLVTMFLIAYIRFMFVVLGWKRKRVVVPMPTRSTTHTTTTNTLAQQRQGQRSQHETDIIRLEVGDGDNYNEVGVDGDQEFNDDDLNIRRRSTFATPQPILEEVVVE